MFPPFLAESDSDAILFMKCAFAFMFAIHVAKAVVWLIEKVRGPVRKPSLDVDLTSLLRRVESLEGDIELINGKLDDGADLHMQLKEGQSANTTRIEDIQAVSHDLSTRLNSMSIRIDNLPNQISQLLSHFKPR